MVDRQSPNPTVKVEAVLRSPFLTQGPVVPAFKQAVANKVCASHAVAVNSATSALHIACLALGQALVTTFDFSDNLRSFSKL